MTAEKPYIDPYLFERQFAAFRAFVEEQSQVPFVSFASHPYPEKQEDYKYQIHRAARAALAFQAWKTSDIGSGEIIAVTIEAIEIPGNNLLLWQSRFGSKGRAHQLLYEAQGDRDKIQQVESCLFRLYHESYEADSFAELVSIFGKRYSLIAYLFFLKDRSKYLPIAPRYFDKAFGYLGAEFRTSHGCSWENYSDYVGLLGELKTMLEENLSGEVTLLDAHSFAWILASQMERHGKLADVQEYFNRSVTERDAIVKARIGQGQFRKHQLKYWKKCAVTGCKEASLLRASHIKPWSKSSPTECLHLYNGLLLSPNLDACFDDGFVSFDDEGKILISSQLSVKDAEAMGLHLKMRLSRVESEHKRYLAYHREHIFQKG